MGVFVLLFFFIFATIVIYSPTPGGRVNKHMGSKLLCKIDKVKFMDVALSTSNSHPIKLFSYSHIVYSIFYCKFEVLQRCSQPNTTIMKTINFTTYQNSILDGVSSEMFGIDFWELSVAQQKKVKDGIKSDWLNWSESKMISIDGVITLVIR